MSQLLSQSPTSEYCCIGFPLGGISYLNYNTNYESPSYKDRKLKKSFRKLKISFIPEEIVHFSVHLIPLIYVCLMEAGIPTPSRPLHELEGPA
jgi:hypothetical protein